MQVYALVIMDSGRPAFVTEFLPLSLLDLLEMHSSAQQESADAATHSLIPYSFLCAIGQQLLQALLHLHGRHVRPYCPAVLLP